MAKATFIYDAERNENLKWCPGCRVYLSMDAFGRAGSNQAALSKFCLNCQLGREDNGFRLFTEKQVERYQQKALKKLRDSEEGQAAIAAIKNYFGYEVVWETGYEERTGILVGVVNGRFLLLLNTPIKSATKANYQWLIQVQPANVRKRTT